MKKTQQAIRGVLIAAVAAAGAAMFIAVARTKLLPAGHLAALGGILAVSAGLIALVARGGKRVRLCAGVLLAAPYIFMTVTGFSLANRTGRLLEQAVVTVSPTMAPTPTAAPTDVPATPEPEPVPEAVEEPEPEPEPESQFPDVFRIFVSGIDSREGLVDKSYSDVNIIFTVNRNTHQILLVTTPRDAFVPLSISDGARDKLTHSGQYGIDVQVDTMEMLYDTDFDYWFRLDFSGFINIVDALGGITVHSDYAFEAFTTDDVFVQGDNQLTGTQALAFARERKAFEDGDFQRGRDQMLLIDALIDKILSPDLLNNYSAVLDSLEGSFETTIPYDLLAELVRDQLAGDIQWDTIHYEVLGSGGYEVTYSIPEQGERYVCWLDEDSLAGAKDLMDRVYNGEIVEQP